MQDPPGGAGGGWGWHDDDDHRFDGEDNDVDDTDADVAAATGIDDDDDDDDNGNAAAAEGTRGQHHHRHHQDESSPPSMPLTATDWADEVFLLAQRLWYFALAGTGICGAALLCVAAGLAGLGLLGLGTAAVLHGVTSEAQDLVAPLFFDYTEGHKIMATSKLLLPKQPELQARLPRVPWAGQVVDLRIEFAMPEVEENCKVFMVKVDLLGPEGGAIESRQRPAMLECRPTLLRMAHEISEIPLSMLGLSRGTRVMTLELFRGYRVRKEHSIGSVSVEISGQAGGFAPQISEASVHAHLKLGWVPQLLFFVRHNVLLFGLLLAAALVSVGCGTCCALIGLGTVVASSTGWLTSLAAAGPRDLPSGSVAGARRPTSRSTSSRRPEGGSGRPGNDLGPRDEEDEEDDESATDSPLALSGAARAGSSFGDLVAAAAGRGASAASASSSGRMRQQQQQQQSQRSTYLTATRSRSGSGLRRR